MSESMRETFPVYLTESPAMPLPAIPNVAATTCVFLARISVDSPKNRKDTDPVAYYILENDSKKRHSICRSIIDRRFYEMVCNDPPRDDF